jgi:hypothetical protein
MFPATGYAARTALRLAVWGWLISPKVPVIASESQREPPVPQVGASSRADVDFLRDIRPLLSDRCFTCHGPDEAARESGLRLDRREAAIAELDSGSVAVVPGNARSSELIARVTSDDPDLRMPPDEDKWLSPAQVDLLTRWIDAGAGYRQHWAFERPVQVPPPPVVGHGSDHPIDRFIDARLRAEGLERSPVAKPEKLIRRISFDLIGLPPSPEEVMDFCAAYLISPSGAINEAIDRLFASPHYGERLAVDWLDIARFADSNGYQNDFARSMWPWRDWVINAYNHNMPYDEFLTEQLAGDLLDHPARQQVVATGFNRNHRTVTEAGSLDEEWRVENVIDRVETTGAAFLGLTIGCARCHDHKFDPISQREFYSFFAFFNSIDEQGVYTETRGNVPPLVRLPTPEIEARLTHLADQITAGQTRLESLEQEAEQGFDGWLSQPDEVQASAPSCSIALAGSPTARVATTNDQGTTSHREVPPAAGEPGPTWTESWFGTTAQFAGHEVLSYQGLMEIDRERPFSVAAWVRRTGEGAIVSKMDDVNGFRGFDMLLFGDGMLLVHFANKWPNDALKISVVGQVPREQWTHVALTYDGSGKAAGLSVYFNGETQEVKVETDSLQGSFANDQPWRIGKRSTERFLQGAVADVQLFDRALPPEEVAAVAAARLVESARNIAAAPAADVRKELRALYLQLGLPSATGSLLSQRRDLAQLRKEKTQIEQALPSVMVMKERGEPRPTYVLKRGMYNAPDESQGLQPNVPGFLPPLPADAPRNRLALARWLVDPAHPLTARVAVNRMWQRLFGTGLVKTAEDFGVQAELPSHPDLLDWLACELIRRDWNLQEMQRLILTSATYQQSSAGTPASFERDPGNRLLSRGPRFRLPAEMVRDNALAVSGLLSRRIGGPSIMPYQPEGLWEELAGGAHEDYVQDHGESLYRRSLYVYRKRTVPHPAMSTFDAPSWEICQMKRSRTNTPLQALALLNDVAYVEAARKLGERMLAQGGDSDTQRIAYGFELATARLPNQVETNWLTECLDRYRAAFRADLPAAKALLTHGESPVNSDAPPEELAAQTTLAGVLLNLDETLTKD